MSSSSNNTQQPIFTPAFGFAHDDEQIDDQQFDYALSLTSPPNEFVFSNDLACHDDEFAFHDDDKAASMRSAPQRDTAIAFDPMMMRADAFVESSSVFHGSKTPTFVLDDAPLSPTFHQPSFDFFATLPTISTKKQPLSASPLSPSAYITSIDVPQKERSDFYAVNPVFTSSESPLTIMDTIKTALASSSLICQWESNEPWTLRVNCMVVAELLTFSIHVLQLRNGGKYEIEFVRHRGDELVFTEVAEHVRCLCSAIDEDGALSLFSKTLEPWINDTQELSGRRYAIKEAEASNLVEELNCDQLHVDTLFQVARSVKNHCRHKGNRKLFVRDETRSKLLQGLKWMLHDNDELVRYALFTMQQFANDDELCTLFFATPFDKSSFALQLDTLQAQVGGGGCKFTSDMVTAVRHSALFA